MFANRCNSGARSTLPAEDVKHLDRLAAADAVWWEPTVLLEVRQRSNRGRPEDAIRAAAVEADVVQRPLEVFDVVTAQLRSFEEQLTVTQPMTCLDECQPGLFVTAPVDIEPTGFLEA